MRKILVICNPLIKEICNEEGHRMLAKHIREKVTISDSFIRWKVISSTQVDLMQSYFIFASELGDTTISQTVLKEIWEKSPVEDKEIFLNKISLHSDFSKILGVVHYQEEGIIDIFKELKKEYSKYFYEDVPFYVAQY